MRRFAALSVASKSAETSSSIFAQPRSTPTLAVVATLTALAIIFVRWILLLQFGHDTPFWDQWDSEIALLYLPYVNGELPLSQWFAPHNEHRILFSRLFNTALFVLNDEQFDNYVETFANAVVYALTLLLVAWPALRRLTGPAQLFAFSILFVVGVVPYGWQNLLDGFQNAFSFLIALTASALAAATLRRGNRALAVALALSFAALFTLASGLAAAAVLIVAVALRLRAGEISGRTASIAISVAAAVVVFGLYLAPATPRDPAAPFNLDRFLSTLASLLSWPVPQASPLCVLMLWWPSAVTLWRRWTARSSDDALDLYLLAICGWVALQCVAIAYGREYAPNTVESRYTDILVLSTLANLVLAVRLTDLASGVTTRRIATAALLLFAVVSGGGFAVTAVRSAGATLAFDAITRETKIHLQAYLSGQGAAAFVGKLPLQISYPVHERLSSLLDNPAVRDMMPPSIRVPLATTIERCTGFQPHGVYPTTAPWPDAYGSFVTNIGNPSTGSCISAAFAARRSYLQFPLAGYLGKPGLTLKLVAGDRSVDILPLREPRETWQIATIAVPGTELQWIATDDNPEYWFAFAPPKEVGRLSVLVQRLMAMLSGAIKPEA